MSLNLKLTALCLLLIAGTATADVHVPEDLKDWQLWVLKDTEYRLCPFLFNSSATQASEFVCAWPGRLELTADTSGASFVQQWTVYEKEQWVAIPGDAAHWPDRVTANDGGAVVVAHNNVPSVRLTPGTWRIAGRFEWDERPGVLRVPPESGLLSLTVDGRRVERPEMNRNGVFLGERKRDTRAQDSVRTVVHRMVVDDIPTRLVTRLQIDVSGSVREEVFGPILPNGFIPLRIQSQLPAKLESDGKLRLQVRPGRWEIHLIARGPGVVNEIAVQSPGVNIPATEIWSFQANDQLRVAAAEGLAPVDPVQVEVPSDWQHYPAFRMDADATFTINERSRGIVSAVNELGLTRTMWLDFGGAGFVVEDQISGAMRSKWRLDMAAPYSLLNATEYDENLLVTKGPDADQTGVEVRQSDVDISAIGRSDTRTAMPVSGWDERFVSVDATLHLPPGHKLLAAPGVDHAPGSWASRWQLLDFFFVLIITIAVWKLFGRGPGLIALLAMAVSLHEINAQAWLWLNLIVAIALFRVVPEGRLRQLVTGYQTLSAVALLLALVPFIAGELRTAIYPQLERQTQFSRHAGFTGDAVDERFEYETDAVDMPASVAALEAPKRSRGAALDSADSLQEIVVTGSRSLSSTRFSRYAPNAIVQAGPGIPSWSWNSYSLSWSGPVDAEQSMRLVVMPRWLVSSLRIVEVGLLLLFAAVLAAEIFKRRWRLPGGLQLGGGQSASVLAAATLVVLMAASPSASADVPDANILQQLQQRLLEPPDCVPRCAEIVSADVTIGADQISMRLTVHAVEDVAIPLPGSLQGWRPESVLLGGGTDTGIRKAPDNSLWLRTTAGQHTITLRGPIPAVDSLEIPFPTPPRVINVDSDSWFVAGVKDRRLLSGSLQLTRLQADTESSSGVRWESSRFPAFARIERVVELDIDWRVRTIVSRVAPAQGALTLDVPLLKGEAIVSGDFTVKDGRVLVSMNPQQHSISWTSNLPLQSPLALTASDGTSWQEVWQFAVGNTWNAEFAGLPESNTGMDTESVRVAVFHPRAGEELVLSATRPEASAGSTLAFDSAHLNITHGIRSHDASLQLEYRSTRGSQHVMQLPAGAEVTSVSIDDRPQLMRAEDGALTLPILPGEHHIRIDWRGHGEMKLWTSTPEVDIGAPASNVKMTLTKPRDRWLLATRGPSLGPAVLYWSELAALIVFAVILGRTGLGPLGTKHWLLLGLGFSTFSWPVLALIVVWILVCGAREKLNYDFSWWKFNLVQIAIGGLTVLALSNIVLSLPMGLLGVPDMHVAGQNSYGNILNWFADRSDSVLPTASLVTVPMWIYKVLILAWALWFSFALLRWLPWVWKCFSSDGFWRSRKTIEVS